MKVLVIPDVHLKPWIFDEAEAVDPSLYDNVVCLGDMVDEWGQQRNIELYKETLDRAYEFGNAHPDMLFCYGNHDFSYLYYLLESGFSPLAISTVKDGLSRMRARFGSRLAIIHRIDDVLFSHAGLTRAFVERFLPEKKKDIKIDTLLQMINLLTDDGGGAEKYLWKDESPLWSRPQLYSGANARSMMYQPENFYQVVGHTPTTAPVETAAFLSLDTFSLKPDGTPIGDQMLVIFDTGTHSWEYAG